MKARTLSFATLAVAAFCLTPWIAAQDSNFHNAPASAQKMKNPYESQPAAAAQPLYHLHCARCHGENGEGLGKYSPLGGRENQGGNSRRDILVHH